MTSTLDVFAAMTNSHGVHPRILMTSILPFDLAANQAYWGSGNQLGANDRIRDFYNPWLAAATAGRGLEYVDLWSGIEAIPNWQGTLMAADGLHPNAAGDAWIADRLAAAIAVPEPAMAAIWIGLAAGLFVAGRGWRKK
jgi:hypothetical protein